MSDLNPFNPNDQQPIPMPTGEVGALSVIERERSEIQAGIISAKKFPRDENAAFSRVMRSFERPSLAEVAKYSFPRGNQRVAGPSVDCARELARCWGNIRYGLRVVSMDDQYVQIKGYACDLETNSYVELEDKFEKLIQRKRSGKAQWVKPDERDLRELINRRGAILIRNAILQLLPPDITEEALMKAEETMKKAAAGELKQNREDAIRRLVHSFSRFGVTSEMLSEWLDHDVALITELELADLRAIWKSIHDGNSRPDEYFKVLEKKASAETESLNQSMAKAQATKKEKQDDAQEVADS